MYWISRAAALFCIFLLAACGNTKLIYVMNDEIRTINDDGTGDRVIRNAPRGGAAWRPDQDEAVFGAIALNTSPSGCTVTGLFEVPAGGGSARTLTGTSCSSGVQDCDIINPDVSSQDEIVATQVAWGSNPCETTPGRKVVKMTANGSGITLVTGSTSGAHHDPHWSPDGTAIAFENNGQIFTVDSSGGNFCQVTTNGGMRPDWGTLQGGDAIAFITQHDVHIATPSGGGACPSYNIRRISSPQTETNLTWMGSALVVVRESGGDWSLNIIDPLNGNLIDTLTTKSEEIFNVDW